jgi:hypothetical protein
MLDLEPTLKKKKGAAFFEIDEDLDKEWIEEHQAFLIEEQRTKINKKFEKDNEKRVADGEKEMKASELEERLQVVKEMEKKFKKENKTGKVEAEARGATVEKLENAIAKIDQRVETMSVQAQDKEDNKEVALGTSKIVSLFRPSSTRTPTNLSNRTTSILVSLSFSARSSMFPSRSSSPRRCVRSLSGLSSPLMRTGNSNPNLSWARSVACNPRISRKLLSRTIFSGSVRLPWQDEVTSFAFLCFSCAFVSLCI